MQDNEPNSNKSTPLNRRGLTKEKKSSSSRINLTNSTNKLSEVGTPISVGKRRESDKWIIDNQGMKKDMGIIRKELERNQDDDQAK
mmetsp:Transcript_15409/g.13143  ORF Transcript_15409/g.13143 Transcript_15409/m.13143 type:complete len:86 (-) Transcript_15409:372-629(-)